MSDFLLLVLEDERAYAAEAPRAIAESIAKRTRFAAALRDRGQLRDHGRLRPSKEGKRVRGATVQDGPFVDDDGKAVAAYYWIAAPSIAEATHLAAEYPASGSDVVDVRPLMKGIAVPDKAARPGKIFAFAVLGTAATEAGWAEVMDRIDAETHDGFPTDAMLGGNRLEAPRRATFDGPFLESKEVIGGVFFLRMMNIDDAVRWAAASRFVVHGALEIRELWRT